MNTTFSRILAGGILAVGAMFAAPVNDVTITLPHAVTVGATTLPSGTYTMTPIETSLGTDYFVVRAANSSTKAAPIMIQVQRVEGDTAAKTSVSFSESGNTWRFGKLSLEGQTTGYQFEQ